MVRGLIRTPLRAAAVATVVTATVVGGVSLAFASIPDSNGVVHGCYQNKGKAHALKVIDNAVTANCPTGYTSLNWNQTGPPGPAGPSNLKLLVTGPIGLSVGPQSCAFASLNASGFVPGDTGLIAPDASKWSPGLIAMPLRVTTAGVLPVDVCNPTTSAVSVSNVSTTIYRVAGS